MTWVGVQICKKKGYVCKQWIDCAMKLRVQGQTISCISMQLFTKYDLFHLPLMQHPMLSDRWHLLQRLAPDDHK